MDEHTRRDALKLIAAAGLTAAGCQDPSAQAAAPDPVRAVAPLGLPPWKTPDPFLFCVHHDDAYPRANEQLGPAASLAGRNLGQDFEGIDGWRMYHGSRVPGFPQHPHRGFETITVVRRGFIDHSDSAGATARYGQGDVQWLTAGKGVRHSEMFPLLDREGPNPVELFQLWLNLPRASKFVDPHFAMFWSEAVPRHLARDEEGRATEVTVVAGSLGEAMPPAPPPGSYASRPESDVAVWTLRLEPGAEFTLPAARPGSNRTLYFFKGGTLKVGAKSLPARSLVELRADVPALLQNGPQETELLLLQGRPIGEPVVQYGPFVMNSQEELRQTFADYQRTGFGEWRWESDEPVHPRDAGRFALRPDGTLERPA